MAARSCAQLLVLAVLLAGAECQEYGAIGAAHREAEVYTSSGGTLTSTLTIDAFRYNGPTAQFWGRAFNEGFPGPTFRIKKGDTWTLTLVNALGPNPTVEQEHNSYKDPNTTNVHTHGLHISGESPGDNVLRVVEPGTSDVYTYELPDDHAGGTFWYHPHHHGSTALQVGGGAAGMIIVEDTAGDIPDIIANAPEVLVMAQYFNINANPSLDDIAGEALDEVTVQDFVGDRDFVLINGLYQPVISMDAGKWYRFRIVHSGTIALLAVTATGCDTQLIAKDGIYLPTAPRQITSAYIVAGGRADIMVRCPAGSFRFESGVRGGQRARNQFTGLLATLSVTEVAGQAADPDLSSFEARKPNYLSDLRGDAVVVDSTFALDLGPGGGGCRINGESWASEANVINSQEVGGVYEWDVSGVQGHPFHLHVNSYQIASVSDATGYLQVGDWHDTLYNPSGDNGAITVRYQTDRFTGKAMMHCHFLPHEDLGCMAIATITGAEGTPGRIAAGYGGGFGATPPSPPTPAPLTPAPDTPAPNTPVPATPAPDTPSPGSAVTYDCRTTEGWNNAEKRQWCCENRPNAARHFGGVRCPRRRELAAPMPKLSSGGLESNTTMRVKDLPSSECPLSPLMVVSLAANLIAVIVIMSLIYCRRTQPQEDKSVAAPEPEAGTRADTAVKLEVEVELDSEAVTSAEGSPGPSPQPSSAPSPLPLARKNNPLAEP